MIYPKYVITHDGYIGTFAYLDHMGYAVYHFEGGFRLADDWELAHGADNREALEKRD